jgi:hypothetical protein
MESHAGILSFIHKFRKMVDRIDRLLLKEMRLCRNHHAEPQQGEFLGLCERIESTPCHAIRMI